MKQLRQSIWTIFLIFAFVFVLNASAYASDYGIIVPDKIIANKAFPISFFGTNSEDTSLNNGRQIMVPNVWTMTTSNQFLADIFIPVGDLDYLNQQRSIIKVKMPGKWTIKSVFYPATYEDLGYGMGMWDENFNLPYEVNKTINVLGTVKFDARKGKLASSAKTKTLSQKAKVGKLPKPSRRGHKFTGWYTKASHGSKISSRTIVKFPGATKTYYAHWR